VLIEAIFLEYLRLSCKIGGIKCFLNDERTRIFIALTLGDLETCKILNDLVNVTDLCLKKFNFPTYYKVK
jgi:hypothetical protein